jgi:hypothetical protein
MFISDADSISHHEIEICFHSTGSSGFSFVDLTYNARRKQIPCATISLPIADLEISMRAHSNSPGGFQIVIPNKILREDSST